MRATSGRTFRNSATACQRVLSDDDPAPLEKGARVAPGHEKFEFHYTALSFLSPEKVLFRYTLEGFDQAWTAAHDRRAAYYTNLPPGHYRFRVTAANNDGVWNEDGASFPAGAGGQGDAEAVTRRERAREGGRAFEHPHRRRRPVKR